MNFKISNNACELIKLSESFRDDAYQNTNDVPTIGWGHTKNVKMGDRITLEAANKLLMEDLSWVEDTINRWVQGPLNQNQVDALASWIFNYGETKFKNSTLLYKINLNNLKPNLGAIAIEFSRWKFLNQVEIGGLVIRRAREIELYFRKCK